MTTTKLSMKKRLEKLEEEVTRLHEAEQRRQFLSHPVHPELEETQALHDRLRGRIRFSKASSEEVRERAKELFPNTQFAAESGPASMLGKPEPLDSKTEKFYRGQRLAPGESIRQSRERVREEAKEQLSFYVAVHGSTDTRLTRRSRGSLVLSLRVYGEETYQGVAKCSPDDKWNSDIGLPLAWRRLVRARNKTHPGEGWARRAVRLCAILKSHGAIRDGQYLDALSTLTKMAHRITGFKGTALKS